MSRLIPITYQPLDVNGNPYPGALLYCYSAGTVISYNTWSVEASIGTANNLNTHPIVADANGRFGNVFGDGVAYALTLKTAAGVVIWTNDPVYGEATARPQLISASSASATAAILGTNTNSGPGGEFTSAAGTGYGVKSTGNGTKPPLLLTPQDAPTSVLAGGVWPDSVTKMLSVMDGVGEKRIIHQIHQIVGSETRAINSAFSTSKKTIPANTLRSGQCIKFRCAANITVAADGLGTCDFTMFFGALGGIQIPVASSVGIAANDNFLFEGEFVITSLGVAGTAFGRAVLLFTEGGSFRNNGMYIPTGTVTINTTIANDIYLMIDNPGAGMSFSSVMSIFTIESSS